MNKTKRPPHGPHLPSPHLRAVESTVKGSGPHADRTGQLRLRRPEARLKPQARLPNSPSPASSWNVDGNVVALVPPQRERDRLKHPSRVAILLCTMQGQHFLAEQLNSVATQTYPNWEIWASDDGSDDDTHAILETYQSHWGENRLSIHDGPAEGSTANFLSLTCRADIDTDFFAYADQDDIWEADKLERAVRLLESVPRHIPALYGSRTQLVDVRNQYIGYSPLFTREPSFANALVQNIAGGNTMVFNRAARDLLRQAGEEVMVISHDWWAYQLITGAGGLVHYDPYPTVRYRQHGANQIGANRSLGARLERLQALMKGRFAQWMAVNLATLQAVEHLLTPANRRLLNEFIAARDSGPWSCLAALRRLGIHRQNSLDTLAIGAAALMRRL